MADAVHSSHGAGSHAHDHPPNLAHHFDTPAQQFDAGKLGMWLFLAQEVLFFAGLFCWYAVYRSTHPEIFVVGHKFLDVSWGAINTVVLILSSFTMALAVWCAQTSRKQGLVICLFLTLLGAFGFMGVKYMEYKHKFEMGWKWGRYYNPQAGHGHGSDAAHAAAPSGVSGVAASAAAATEGYADPSGASHPAGSMAAGVATPANAAAVGPAVPKGMEPSSIALAPAGPTGLAVPKPVEHDSHNPTIPTEDEVKNVHIYLGIYFCMTGLHGIHVVAGIIVIGWLLWGAIKGRYDATYYTPIDLGGLYWHLVDLVWIFLFPLLYLIG